MTPEAMTEAMTESGRSQGAYPGATTLSRRRLFQRLRLICRDKTRLSIQYLPFYFFCDLSTLFEFNIQLLYLPRG